MNKKLLFLPLISCALLVSCTEEGTNDPNNTSEFPKQAQGKTVTFKAAPVSIETKSASTKVNIKPNGESDVLEWAQSGDAVSVLFDAGVSKQYYTDFTVEPVSGGFELSGGNIPRTEGNYKVYAIYPAGNYFVGNYADESVLTIPRVQTQTQNSGSYSHLKDFLFLYGGTSQNIAVDSESNSVGDYELNFTPKVSLLRFDITNSSNKNVTLNHVKISFERSVGLHKTATLNEKTGVLTPSLFDSHADMTLNLPTPTLTSSITTPYSAYMVVFNTPVTDKLLIVLNVTVDGETEDILFELPDTTFGVGEKTQIGLEIDADYFDEPAPGIIRTNLAELTWTVVRDSELIKLTDATGIWVNVKDLLNVCPDGWDTPRYWNVFPYTDAVKFYEEHKTTIGGAYLGASRLDTDYIYWYSHIHQTVDLLGYLGMADRYEVHGNSFPNLLVRPLCYRPLP